MSTTQRELEELRKAREAARLQAEEEKRKADEKAAMQAKKNAFLAKATAFQQKKGPSDEELREQVKKESQKRTVARKLDKALKANPSGNPLALELGLRGKANNNTHISDDHSEEALPEWGYVRPPPPPPRMLPGMGPKDGGPPPPPPRANPDESQPAINNLTHSRPPPPRMNRGGAKPPPPAPPAAAAPPAPAPPAPPAAAPPAQPEPQPELEPEPESQPEPVEEAEVSSAEAPRIITWVYVCENEPTPYYWNIQTNESTFDPPAEWDGTIFSAEVAAEAERQKAPQTQEPTITTAAAEEEEEEEEEEETTTQFLSDAEIAYVLTGESNEHVDTTTLSSNGGSVTMWQAQSSEDGESIGYINLSDGREVTERPVGDSFIVVIDEQTGEEVHWQEYVNDDGQATYFNMSTAEVSDEKPLGTLMIVQSLP